MAELVTLAGDYGYSNPSRYNRRYRNKATSEELMAGIGDFLKSAGNMAILPFKAVGKSIGHTTMETYRGIKTGNFKRILKAPFKGTTHGVMTAYRDTKSHTEYYWRPSKMKEWMGPVGAAVTAIGAVPGPHSVFMLPIGALLSVGGALGNKMYVADQIKQAKISADSVEAKEANMASYMWLGVGALALGGTFMLLT